MQDQPGQSKVDKAASACREPSQKDRREDRLKQALKANMGRRKAQAKSRAMDPGAEIEGADGADNENKNE